MGDKEQGKKTVTVDPQKDHPTSTSRTDLQQGRQTTREPQNQSSNPRLVRSSTSSSSNRRPVESESSHSQYIEDDAYSIKLEIANFLNRLDSSEDLANYPGAERSHFDFSAERKSLYTTNLVESTGHMIKGMLGVGILSMHEAYMHGGTVTGLVASCVLGFVGPFNTLMLVKTAQNTYQRMRIAKMTYPDLMEAAVAKGPKCLRKYRRCFRYTADVFLIVELCSSCNIYQIMTAITLSKVVEAFVVTKLNIRIYIIIVAVPLILLCAIKRLKILARLSIVGDVFIVLCVVIALGFSIPGLPPITERAIWNNFQGLFGFTGIFIYSIDSITLALPIENNMTRPLLFPVVAWIAIPIVITFCTLAGFFGYWKWGNECISPMILHLPMTVGTLILYFMFALVLALTYSVHFWIPFKIIWRYQKKRIKENRGRWEALGRFLLVIIITIISVAFPDIRTFIGLIGNVFLGVITFIFPPIIDVFITYKDRVSYFRRFINVLSLISGFFVVGGGFYSMFYGKYH